MHPNYCRKALSHTLWATHTHTHARVVTYLQQIEISVELSTFSIFQSFELSRDKHENVLRREGGKKKNNSERERGHEHKWEWKHATICNHNKQRGPSETSTDQQDATERKRFSQICDLCHHLETRGTFSNQMPHLLLRDNSKLHASPTGTEGFRCDGVVPSAYLGRCTAPRGRIFWRCRPGSRPPADARPCQGVWGRSQRPGAGPGSGRAPSLLPSPGPCPWRSSPPSTPSHIYIFKILLKHQHQQFDQWIFVSVFFFLFFLRGGGYFYRISRYNVKCLVKYHND